MDDLCVCLSTSPCSFIVRTSLKNNVLALWCEGTEQLHSHGFCWCHLTHQHDLHHHHVAVVPVRVQRLRCRYAGCAQGVCKNAWTTRWDSEQTNKQTKMNKRKEQTAGLTCVGVQAVGMLSRCLCLHFHSQRTGHVCSVAVPAFAVVHATHVHDGVVHPPPQESIGQWRQEAGVTG